MTNIGRFLKNTLFGFGLLTAVGSFSFNSYAEEPQTQTPVLEIELPESVTLTKGNESVLTIPLSGDVTERKRVLLNASNVVMYQEGKDPVTVEIIREGDDYYSYEDILNGTSDTIRINADGLSAGTWTGELIIDVTLAPEFANIVEYEGYGQPFLNCPDTSVTRPYIKSLQFSSSTNGHSLTDANCWDVSDWNDGSILAWYEGDNTSGYDIVIASDYGMRYPKKFDDFFSYLGYSLPNGAVLSNLDIPKAKDITSAKYLFEYANIAGDFTFDIPLDKANTVNNMFSHAIFKDGFTWGEHAKFDNVKDTKYMFSYCKIGEKFDISKLDTPSVTNFYAFMQNAQIPDGEYVFNFDTSKASNTAYMFSNLKRYTGGQAGPNYITSVTLGPKFNTENVTGLYYFSDKNNPLSRNDYDGHIGGYTDTYNNGGMAYMFENCKIKNLNLGSAFDTSNVVTMESMFSSASITNLNFGNKFNCENVLNMNQMFYNYNDYNDFFEDEEYSRLTLPNTFNASSCLKMSKMFYSSSYQVKKKEISLGNNFGGQSCLSMTGMFSGQKDTDLNLGSGFYTDSCKYMDSMFDNYANGDPYNRRPITLNLGDHFDMSKCETMYKMFYYTDDISELTLGNNFNCNSVLDAESAFHNCGYNLMETFEVPDDFNLTSATNAKNMFRSLGYSKLKNFNLGNNFGGNSVENGERMFSEIGYNSKTLEEVNLGDLTLPNCTNADYTFEGIGNESLAFENFRLPDDLNLKAATNVNQTFAYIGARSLRTFHCGNNLNLCSATAVGVKSYSGSTFKGIGQDTLEVFDFGDNANLKNAGDLGGLLEACGSGSGGYNGVPTLREIYFGKNFNAESVLDASYLFRCNYPAETHLHNATNHSMDGICGRRSGSVNGFNVPDEMGNTLKSIEIIDLGDNFNLKTASSVHSMFYGCGANTLKKINLGKNFNAANVTDASDMFYGAGYYSEIEEINLGDNPGFGKAINMAEMFNRCGYYHLENLTIPSTFSVASATDTSYMFGLMPALKTLSLPENFNPSKSKNMSGMFYGLGHYNMTEFHLPANFNTSSAENMVMMFSEMGVYKMKEFILPDSFDTHNVKDFDHMFDKMGYFELEKLYLGNNFDISNSILIKGENVLDSSGGLGDIFNGVGHRTLKELYLGPKFIFNDNAKTAWENGYAYIIKRSDICFGAFNGYISQHECVCGSNCTFTAAPKVFVKDISVAEWFKNLSKGTPVGDGHGGTEYIPIDYTFVYLDGTEVIFPEPDPDADIYGIYDADGTKYKSLTLEESGTDATGVKEFITEPNSSVILPKGITSIGENAFKDCVNLKAIEIKAGVTEINDDAFSDCTSLTDITIPNEVTDIKRYAFYNCSSLQNIVLPANLTHIGFSTFSNTGLTSINLPENLEIIEYGAFYKCKFTTLVIPDSVTRIDSTAFSDCKNLETVVLSNNITELSHTVFYGCNNLTTITIPDSVTKIGNNAFGNCSSLQAINIPNGVTFIDEGAFTQTGLKSVTIPNSVTQIGNIAFKGCSSLQTANISGNNLVIGIGAFSYCTALTNLSFSDNIITIGEFAFGGCTSLESVIINAETIGKTSFQECTSLTSVTFGNTVNSIGDAAFFKCTSITSAVIPGNVKTIGASIFSGCPLTSVTIEEGVDFIQSGAFANNTLVDSITVPNSVTTVYPGAFQNVNHIEYHGSLDTSTWGAKSIN